MRQLSLAVGIFCALVFLALSADAAVRLDHKKLSVSYSYIQLPNATAPVRFFRLPDATEPVILRSFASYSVDYESQEFFEVAEQKVADFLAAVRSIGFNHIDRSAMDYLYFGSWDQLEKINTRVAVPIDPKRTPRAVFKPGEHGLYVLQVVAYWKPEWVAILKERNVRLVWYASDNGLIVATTPEVAKELIELPWVQFIEPYHPFLKSRLPVSGDKFQYMTVNMVHLPGNDEGWEFARAVALSESGISESDQGVAGMFPTLAIPLLLAHDCVIGVFGPSGLIISSMPPAPIPTPVDIPALDAGALVAMIFALLCAAWTALR